MPSKKAKGKRSKTRSLMTKKTSKVTVNKILQEIPVGSKVDIKIDSSIHSGLPSKNFHGFTGEVLEKQGRAFVVSVSKGKQVVKLIVGPAHLTISKGSNKAVEEVAA